MVNGILGKKVGMTQVFDENGAVVPVTVVDVGNIVVTQVKTCENDGYAALQLGILKKKMHGKAFEQEWLKAKKACFERCKEISLAKGESSYSVGQMLTLEMVNLAQGKTVSVTSKSRGLGFQGVVKRWNFAGGPKTHGSKFHRRPGAISNMRTQGEVLKGKKLPGHAGDRQVTVKGLKVVRIDVESSCIFIKGAIPGKKNTLVIINKQGD